MHVGRQVARQLGMYVCMYIHIYIYIYIYTYYNRSHQDRFMEMEKQNYRKMLEREMKAPPYTATRLLLQYFQYTTTTTTSTTTTTTYYYYYYYYHYYYYYYYYYYDYNHIIIIIIIVLAVTFISMPIPRTVCITNRQNKWVQQEVRMTFSGQGYGCEYHSSNVIRRVSLLKTQIQGTR